MSALVVFTETGFFHCGCVLDFSEAPREWLGFQPDSRASNQAAGFVKYWAEGCPGYIERRSRGKLINYYVRFRVEGDGVLRNAERASIRDYVVKNDVYAFGVRDCVTFARDIARYCGLDVTEAPPARARARHAYENREERTGVDVLPYELLRKLYERNARDVLSHNWDDPGPPAGAG